MPKVVINNCFGGFGISEAAYEKLIEWGVGVKKYVPKERDTTTGRYKSQPLNGGEVIFDRDLDDPPDKFRGFRGRYWETWLDKCRDHPLLVRVVEELGEQANGKCAALKVVVVPSEVAWEISEYDGNEWVAEEHRTWP